MVRERGLPAGTPGVSPKAVDNMVWTSFRYYIPVDIEVKLQVKKGSSSELPFFVGPFDGKT